MISEPLLSMYPHKEEFFTQLDKTNYLIEWFGHERFKEKYLESKFPNDIARTIGLRYKDIMLFREGKKTATSFGEELQKMDIDVDMHIHRSAKRVEHYPATVSKKYGKTARSHSDKDGFYVADELPHMNKKASGVHAWVIDPYMPIAHYGLITNPREDQFIQRLFAVQESAKQEDIFKVLDDLSDKTYQRGVTQINRLKRIVEQNVKDLDMETYERFLKAFYDTMIRKIGDTRGMQLYFNTEGSITDRGSIIARNKDQYVEGTIEEHNKEKDQRVIDSVHGKWQPERFGAIERYEIQIFNTPGIILDNLGPDNKFKYKSTILNTKYKDFSKGQRQLAKSISDRVYTIAKSLEPGFKRLVDSFQGRFMTSKGDFMVIAYEEAKKAQEEIIKSVT